MTVVVEWLRIDLRRRWRSLLVLALLIALASGTVFAAVAGARRGASAVDRLIAETLPATVVARANVLGFDWSKVRAMPAVEAVSTFPGYSGFGVDEAPAETVQVYLPGDDQAMRTIERPVVLKGRLADPTRVDEAVVTANFVDTYGRGVGDQVTLRLFTEVQAVRALPLLLGAFLAVLAVGAVGHALATAVRRRRHDLAVLRALGMTRRQGRSVVITQASLLAVFGLLFGVPLGIALGRVIWRLIAENTPLAYVAPTIALAVLIVIAAALLLANLLAALPGRWAARLPVHRILRAE